MNRETKTIKTPSGHEVEIKTWLTGRERQEINTKILEEQNDESIKTGKFELNKKSLFELQNETIRQYISSIKNLDGKSVDGDFLEYVLDLKETDYNFISSEINKLTEKEVEVLKK